MGTKYSGPVMDSSVLQLVGLGVAGGVDVGHAAVHHLRAVAQEAVDHPVDVELVARDGMAGQDDRVVLAHLQPPVLARGHEPEGGHRLALGAGRDDADLLRRQLVHVLDVDQRGIGDAERAQVTGQAHVLPHRHAERGHDPAAGDGRVGDLLDAVDVAGEAGRDDAPAPLLGEQRPQDRSHRALARGVAVLLGVGGVGQEQADALRRRDGAHAGQVGAAIVDRGEVQLEVPGVEDHALRGVDRDGEGMGHRVRDGDELDVEGADVPPVAVGDHDQLGLPEEPGFLDAVAGQAQRERGAVDREREALAAGSCSAPTWSSWPWVATQPTMRSAFCRR